METKTPLPERQLLKSPTGIQGIDEITRGGLPQGRPSLVCGGAGCGKTLFGIEFLCRGALQYGEPGVFMAFEESSDELAANVRSLGYDLPDLVERELLLVDQVRIERSEVEVTGEYDLEGLFVRLGAAIDAIGAKRVVLDTIESLFSALENPVILRAELRRLFRWLKEKGVTAVITGERGEHTLTRQGLEEYVSDCVILLDHRMLDQVSTRRLRVVKYRGTAHGTNEYPFLIDENGFSVLPITSLRLAHGATEERVSIGVPDLDAMLDGGMYRGSSVLITGTPGTFKTTLAAHAALASCRRDEKCLFFAYEESPAQICRNLRSAGVALAPWLDKGLLHIEAARPTFRGLESHLVAMHDRIRAIQPKLVVVDPINNFSAIGSGDQVKAMFVRLVDYLKATGITGVFTSLAGGPRKPLSASPRSWTPGSSLPALTWTGNGSARSLLSRAAVRITPTAGTGSFWTARACGWSLSRRMPSVLSENRVEIMCKRLSFRAKRGISCLCTH